MARRSPSGSMSSSENGVDGVTQKKAVFGLNTKQLSVLHDDLTRPVDFSTRKLPPAEVFAKIKVRFTTPIAIDAAAQQALDGRGAGPRRIARRIVRHGLGGGVAAGRAGASAAEARSAAIRI